MSSRAVAWLAAMALVAMPACGDDDGGASSDRGVLAITTSDPSAEKVDMEAPETVDAGVVRITLTNEGDVLHDAQLFRVDGNRKADDVVFGVLESVDNAAKPDWLHPTGGVAPVRPGETATVTQVLRPGTYFIADTQEREKVGGKLTNAGKGGIVKLEVAGEGGGRLPATPATIAASEKGFEVEGLRPGRNRVTFVNRGEELHQVVAWPVPPGVSYQRAARDVVARDIGWVPVPVHHSRATTVLDSGERQVTELSLPRGRYLLACYVSDRAGGLGHLMTEGMTALEVPSSETARPDAAAR